MFRKSKSLDLSIRTFICFCVVLLLIGCGSSADKTDENNASDRERSAVAAVELNYVIKLDNIPLMGPQTESGTLTVSEDVVRYDGIAEVVMGDDSRKIERIELLDFRDQSLSILQPTDSSYTTLLFDKREVPSDSLLNSSLRVVATDEVIQIDEFMNCRKITINDRAEKSKSAGRLDRNTYLNGAIWIKSDLESANILSDYYRNLAAQYSVNNFDGIELWRILSRLDVDQTDLQLILLTLDGAVVRAEFVVETVTMNKKARINVSLNLTQILERNINSARLEIPDFYNVKF